MKIPDLKPIEEYVLERLSKELSVHLSYHSLFHTSKEVVPASTQLSKMEKLEEEENVILIAAAWFHDLGFIYTRDDHEGYSIAAAREFLPKNGFKDHQVEKVCGIIEATRLQRIPQTLSEKIIKDADLFSLGKENFLKRSDDLRQELTFFGADYNDQTWYIYQIDFLEKHDYFTESAKAFQNAGKSKNLDLLRVLLDESQCSK
ncbi:MAG: HD domain-containing protein [Anaerolineaceae bacterium]|nr:HD domain-containing protein [Anaerolineaceae bacterium]